MQMAIIRKESSFIHNAKPPRTELLGFIPWKRPSSAVGYAQAIDGTWEQYKRETGNGWASRKNFGDAVDFVGWYANRSRKLSGIAKNDAYRQYLAYHEGQGGYNRGSYKGNKWLLNAAARTRTYAANYRKQLQGCRADLDKKRGWFFGLF